MSTENNDPVTLVAQNLINAGKLMHARIQYEVEVADFYCRHARKATLDVASGGSYPGFLPGTPPSLELGGNAGERRSYSLKHSAIQSPEIHLSRLGADPNHIKENTTKGLAENLKWIWGQLFQKEIVAHCGRRSVIRKLTALPKGVAEDSVWVGSYDFSQQLRDIQLSYPVSFPIRVNFFGKAVPPFQYSAKGIAAWCISKKYKRAAEQVVSFHPDIVEFGFPDSSQWIGTITWKNIYDAETNPDGDIGFYCAKLSVVARPLRPELGHVVTVVPPGIRGFFWYWAWKLIGYVP